MPQYIKDGGGGGRPRLGAARMWSPTRTPSPGRSPPRGEEGRRKWRRRKGGRPPSLSFPLGESYSNKDWGGSPTPSRSRTPPAPSSRRTPRGRPHLPPPSFIYGGRGAPHDTQVDLRDHSLAVCGAPLHHIPPRSYRPEFRRSHAPVVHHHRHHAVVLTELIPDTLLDRSPGIVIELNVC